MPATVRNPYASLPAWLQKALLAAETSPLTTAIPSAGGKSLSEWIGTILSPEGEAKSGGGLPKRLSFSRVDPTADTAALTNPAPKRGAPSTYEARPHEIATLLRDGQLAPEPGPHEGKSVSQLVRRLQRVLANQDR